LILLNIPAGLAGSPDCFYRIIKKRQKILFFNTTVFTFKAVYASFRIPDRKLYKKILSNFQLPDHPISDNIFSVKVHLRGSKPAAQ
jgi:hypothetical protein